MNKLINFYISPHSVPCTTSNLAFVDPNSSMVRALEFEASLLCSIHSSGYIENVHCGPTICFDKHCRRRRCLIHESRDCHLLDSTNFGSRRLIKVLSVSNEIRQVAKLSLSRVKLLLLSVFKYFFHSTSINPCDTIYITTTNKNETLL